jgi:hypothetical protein
MGGHTFPGIPAQRLTIPEIQRITALVEDVVRGFGVACRSPPEIADKTSFGDVDIVVHFPANPERKRALFLRVQQALQATVAPITSGHVVSFLSAERYQIDLIDCVSAHLFDCTAQYLSHGDLSMILGTMLIPWRLKLGMEGLGIVLTVDDVRAYARARALPTEGDAMAIPDGYSFPKALAVLSLSHGVDEIYEFLGLPRKLFDGVSQVTADEVIDLVQRSPFFSAATFVGGNQAYRHRQKTRPLFQRFVSSLHGSGAACESEAAAEAPPGFLASTVFGFGVEAAYEQRMDELLRLVADQALQRRAKGKFSGRVAQEWCPRLSKQGLGIVMRALTEKAVALTSAGAAGAGTGPSSSKSKSKSERSSLALCQWVCDTSLAAIRSAVEREAAAVEDCAESGRDIFACVHVHAEAQTGQ